MGTSAGVLSASDGLQKGTLLLGRLVEAREGTRERVVSWGGRRHHPGGCRAEASELGAVSCRLPSRVRQLGDKG